MATYSSSKIVVFPALNGNLLVATTKFVAACFGGSSAMLREGVHFLADTRNEIPLRLCCSTARGGPPSRATRDTGLAVAARSTSRASSSRC